MLNADMEMHLYRPINADKTRRRRVPEEPMTLLDNWKPSHGED